MNTINQEIYLNKQRIKIKPVEAKYKLPSYIYFGAKSSMSKRAL